MFSLGSLVASFLAGHWRGWIWALAGAFLAWQAFSLHDRWVDDPSVRREALKGYVLEAEKSAAVALAEERKRQTEIAEQAATSLRGEIEAMNAKYLAEDLQNARDIAEYQKRLAAVAGRTGCRLTQSDLDWLHRNTAPAGGK